MDMTDAMAPWRLTYTPGEWLVLSGPTMVVVMLPAPPRLSGLVNNLWNDILASRSVDALLATFAQYGLDSMADFAAFFWDEDGLHGLTRGELDVVDADTGESVVNGSGLVTWREESLGTARRLRVGMQEVDAEELLQLPLVVGAAMASAVHLNTDPAALVRFPEGGARGLLASSGGMAPATGAEPSAETHLTQSADDAWEDSAAIVAPAEPGPEDSTVEIVELGEEMEPFTEPTDAAPDEDAVEAHQAAPEVAVEPEDEVEPAHEVEPGFDPEPESGPSADEADLGGFRFDAADDGPRTPTAAPLVPPPVTIPRPAPAGDVELNDVPMFTAHHAASSTSTSHAAEAEPEPDTDRVWALSCPHGHVNPPETRSCRLCSAPIEESTPRLIDRPALAGVHSNRGDFVDVRSGVVIGRSPSASKGPAGAAVLRVPSPSSDISRSHVLVRAQDWALMVTDLHSTNGTAVVPVSGKPFTLEDGATVEVQLGTVLDLGDGVSLRIEPPRG